MKLTEALSAQEQAASRQRMRESESKMSKFISKLFLGLAAEAARPSTQRRAAKSKEE